MATIEFVCADNKRLLEVLPRNRFHHVITDPPYTKYVQDRLLAGKTKSAESPAYTKEVEAGFDPLGELYFVKPLLELVPGWHLYFCALEDLGRYQQAAPEQWVRSGIYCKVRAMPQMSGDRPGNRCEGISIFHGAGKKRWNGGGTHAFYVAMPENRKHAMHPTSKPLMLCMKLVEQYTDPGETILDPFCGAGNIGIACALLDRNYFGCDINTEYVQAARSKLENLDRDLYLKKYETYKANNWSHDDV